MPESPSRDDATLSGLELEPGTLVPTFYKPRMSYLVEVPHNVEHVTITATTSHPEATLRIDGRDATSGKPTTISVDVGRTAVPVEITAADGETRSTYEAKVYRGADRPDWQCVAEHGAYAERDSEGEVTFDGRMWLIGGYTPAVVNDVWASADGIDWQQTGNVPTESGVNIPVCLAFNDRMWVTSQNGVLWSSRDGKTWENTGTPPWAPRGAAGFTVFKDRMWVIGGSARGRYRNDVWSSADGANWRCETEAAAWSPRQVYSNLVTVGGRMWLIGGGLTNYQPFRAYRDVWSSADGIHWECATDEAPWPGRIWTSCAAYRGRMWLLGGFRAQPTWQNFDDVWFSADGSQWTRLETDHIWEPRHEISALVHDDSLWVVAGNAWPLKNDSWRLHIEGLTFITNPVLEEHVGTAYRYDARADFHASRSKLVYRLVEAPAWLSINASTGNVRGRAPEPGDYNIAIEAADYSGESATQRYTLHVMDS